MDDATLLSLATALGAGLGALGKGLLDWQKTRTRVLSEGQAQERTDAERVRLDLRDRVRELEKRLDQVNDKLDQTQEQLRVALTQLALVQRENQELRDQVLSYGDYNILVIEDDHDARALIELKLRQAGRLNFRITNAESLEAGIREAYRNHFAAILLDLDLPDSQGLSTLERLRREVPSTPVVVLTAATEPTQLQQARLIGASAVLSRADNLNERDLVRELVLASEAYRTQFAVTRRLAELSARPSKGEEASR